jgi:hypothetical protein
MYYISKMNVFHPSRIGEKKIFVEKPGSGSLHHQEMMKGRGLFLGLCYCLLFASSSGRTSDSRGRDADIEKLTDVRFVAANEPEFSPHEQLQRLLHPSVEPQQAVVEPLRASGVNPQSPSVNLQSAIASRAGHTVPQPAGTVPLEAQTQKHKEAVFKDGSSTKRQAEDSKAEQLAKLATLRSEGILDDAEYLAAKAKVMGDSPADQLAKLSALNSAGIIDNAEFLKAKAKVRAELLQPTL